MALLPLVVQPNAKQPESAAQPKRRLMALPERAARLLPPEAASGEPAQ